MLIHWDDTAEHIYNHVRGLSPYPAAFTHIGLHVSTEDGLKPCVLKIFEIEVLGIQSRQKPGSIRGISDKKLIISTKDFDISVKILQIEGKKRMKTEDFLAGFRANNYTDYLY
jgi:methionyl-tRNA formyltransferase